MPTNSDHAWKTLLQRSVRTLQLNGGVLVCGVDLDAAEGADDLRKALASAVLDGSRALGTTGACVFRCVPALSTLEGNRRGAARDTIERDRWTVTLTGTLEDFSPEGFAAVLGGAKMRRRGGVTELRVPEDGLTPIPRLCWVGDTVRGLAAVELLNAVSTGGLQMTIREQGTGSLAFAFRACAGDPHSGEAPCRMIFFEETAEPSACGLSEGREECL